MHIQHSFGSDKTRCSSYLIRYSLDTRLSVKQTTEWLSLRSLLSCIRETQHLSSFLSTAMKELLHGPSATQPVYFQYSFLRPFSSLVSYRTCGQDLDSYTLRQYKELKEKLTFQCLFCSRLFRRTYSFLGRFKQTHFWARSPDNKAKCTNVTFT